MKLIALCCLVASPALAQDVPVAPAGAIVAQKVVVGSSLPSNTEILLTMNGELTTKGHKVGDTFDLTVARDVMLGDYIVIPRGTPAHGHISYRTGKGAFGKSAKMEFDLTDLQLAKRAIPISGHYRVEGNGNTGAAVGAVVAVGVFGAFVTGHSATAAQGSEWKAYTREPLEVAMASAPATSAAN